MKESKPRLENWFVGPNDQLFGEVYGHPIYFDGENVITSRVVKFNKENGTAETNNSEYILGKPANIDGKETESHDS